MADLQFLFRPVHICDLSEIATNIAVIFAFSLAANVAVFFTVFAAMSISDTCLYNTGNSASV